MNKKLIYEQLASEEEAVFSAAMAQIEEEGTLAMVSDLFNILLDETRPESDRHDLENRLHDLLASVRNSDFRPLLIDRLRHTESPSGQAKLLRIVWESPLDFSDYLDLFISQLKSSDFSVMMEAATVLENLQILGEDEEAIMLSEQRTPAYAQREAIRKAAFEQIKNIAESDAPSAMFAADLLQTLQENE